MVTLQSAENALKSVYLGAVTELLNTKVNPLYTKIEQTSADVCGKEIRKAATYGINAGIGAGDEDGNLPVPKSKDYIQFVSTLKNLYGQIEISDKAIRASADSKGSFTDLLNAELQGLLDASKFNLGRMLYGDGSGKLTNIGTKNTTTGRYNAPMTNNLVEGLIVDIYDLATDQKSNSGVMISSIDHENRTINFSKELTTPVANESGLYIQGSRNKEITGLGAIFGNKPLYGVDRTGKNFMTPYTKKISNTIDEIIMQQAIDRLEINAGSVVDFIAVSLEAKYGFQEYMAQYKRNIDIMELAGGFKTLSFNGIPLVYDRFVENNAMYLLNTKLFKLHQLCDWQYLETENGKILRQTQGKPTYSATLVKYCELMCDNPSGQAKLSAIIRV